jgi:hypothetical protein
MRPKTVVNQNTWLLIRPRFNLKIEHTFKSFQTDLKVGVPRFGARIILFKGGVRGLVASIS